MLINFLTDVSNYINSLVPLELDETEWINIIGLEVAMICILCAILSMERATFMKKYPKDTLGLGILYNLWSRYLKTIYNNHKQKRRV